MKCFLAFVIVLTLSLPAAEPYFNGEIRFPAKKLFNQEEGTYEVWFKQELPVDDKRIKTARPAADRSVISFWWQKTD